MQPGAPDASNRGLEFRDPITLPLDRLHKLGRRRGGRYRDRHRIEVDLPPTGCQQR